MRLGRPGTACASNSSVCAWGLEDGLAVGLFRIHSVHEQTVPVWVEFQVGVAPLHDGDRSAAPVGDTLGAHVVAVEAKHRVHEDSPDGAQQFPVVGQAL
jgi:hypothetical protein